MADRDKDPRLEDLSCHLMDDPLNPIKLPEGTLPIEIKLALLNVLPKFFEKKKEDPYNFLCEFIKICRIQKCLGGVTEEQFGLAVLPFTLSSEANAWFTSLSPDSIETWPKMKKISLEYLFPATKTNALKKEITGVQQGFDESLNTYWGIFKRLVDSCPNHKLSEGNLLQYFYQGMTVESRNLANASSG